MSNLNLLISLNAYKDTNPVNAPTKSLVKWLTSYTGITINEPNSSIVDLASGESASLFSGAVDLDDDNTTTYNLALKAGSNSTYVLSYNSGSYPNFKDSRVEASDATTQITVTKNGPLLTFTSTGGTALNLIVGGVIVGDEVRLGTVFNSANRGKYKILDRSATSFTVQNNSGVAEGPITLGASFIDQLRIYSTAGVQIGQKLNISADFSSSVFGTYEITDVADTYIEFYSINVLPTQSAIATQLNIYSSSKQFLYLEYDKKIALTVNGQLYPNLEVFSIGTSVKPGTFMIKSEIYSLSVQNKSLENASIFYLHGE